MGKIEKISEMEKDYEVTREKERQRLIRIRNITKNARASLIKKLRLKKGCQYILIIPQSAGLRKEEIAGIDSAFVSFSILVQTTRGIKVIESVKEEEKGK